MFKTHCLCASVVLMTLILISTLASSLNLYAQAEELSGQGRHAESALKYEEYLKKKPVGSLVPAALMALSWEYLHIGYADGALKALHRLRTSGKHVRMMDLYLYTTGIANKKAGHYANAIRALENMIGEYPESRLVADAELYLAASLVGDKKYVEAMPLIKTLMEKGRAPVELLILRYEILKNMPMHLLM